LLTARRVAVVAPLACALALVVGGLAFWTTSGSGSASSVVATLGAPAPTATSPTFGTAHVAWSAVTLVPAVPAVDVEVTFIVERKLSGGSTWTFVCGTGATPKPYNVLSCDDSPPASGAYDYRVTAALRSWTSSGSASVSIDDTVPPTSDVTFPSASAVYSAASWNAGCSGTTCGTASDTGGSGLQKVEVSLQRGSGSYWNGSSFSSATQVWSPATGTASWAYGFAGSSFPADGSYTVSSRATDNASNLQSPVTTRTFTIDTTAPVVSASAIASTSGTGAPGFAKQNTGYNVYADVADTNGVASVTANVSAVTTGQTAVALSACVSGCTVGGHAYGYKSAAVTASNPLAEGSKSYSVSASDIVGNAAAPTSFAVVVDNTGPSISTVVAGTSGTSPSGFVKQGGTYRVYANVTDLPSGAGASSGVDASTITADLANVSNASTTVALTSCGTCGPGSAYAYQSAVLTATSPLSEGNKTYSVSASDNLGSPASSSGANVQVDNTAPSVSTVLANTTTGKPGWLAQGGSYRVYANVTDLPSGAGASSGVDAASITVDVSSITTGQTAVGLTTTGCPCTVGGTSYAYQTAALTASNPLAAGTKSFVLNAADDLGTATAQSGSVTVDNTAPALSTLQMFDTDADGKVDQVKATFGETLSTYSAGTTPWTLANAPGGAGNTLGSVSVATTIATLTLNEGSVNTASGPFTVALTTNASGIRDFAGNQSSFSATSVADKAAPVPTNVVLANGGTAGRATKSDTVTVTYSETMDATSFCSAWSNGANQTLSANGLVVVTINNVGLSDTLTVATTSGCSFNLGTIGLGADYVNAPTTFSGNGGNASILAWNPTAKTLTITLGTGNGSQTSVGVSTPTYAPSTMLDDLASPGNTMTTALFSAPATSRF
jgi:hypothetical protein